MPFHRRPVPLRHTLLDLLIGFVGGTFIAVVLWMVTMIYWLPV